MNDSRYLLEMMGIRVGTWGEFEVLKIELVGVRMSVGGKGGGVKMLVKSKYKIRYGFFGERV